MRIVPGFVCTSLRNIYAGQVISAVNAGLAQRLGLQEKPGTADPLFSCLEKWTARWDVGSFAFNYGLALTYAGGPGGKSPVRFAEE